MAIHPSAVVAAGACVPESCNVGPFCLVGEGVEMGEHCELVSHVVLGGPAKLGSHNRIHPFAVVGVGPQDLSYKGEPTRLEMGDHNEIREYVTIHRGTVKGGGLTRIGSHCLLMAYAHIAHDCVIGDHVCITGGVCLSGGVRVGARSYIGAGSFKNTDETLARWIQNPQAMKKGVLMPNLGVTPEEAKSLVAFLRAHQ